ncbi:phage capsid protein [Acetobacter cibinongensis]|uniref:Phage capsid protein n=1 Tax=Acetobacter cibinongensis TaxID=146475 RepID=A0A0D6N7X6_9PROT|nr:phage major capsid protein [Acetobacter cibinongensis]GAN61601.1 phage major capsid protein HK97 [Acetobacter cibinongensis]GBQ17626.1 GTA major capsid protein [Acetobacter cibinongensis NRIC 0482]GEL59904.1 phage capsid protein [Acetobacter cibinongensis]
MTSKELRAKRAKLIEDARALTSAESMTAEQVTQFDAMMAEASQIMAQITRMEQADNAAKTLAEGIAARAEEGGVSPDQQESEERQQERVFVAWLRGGIDALNTEDRTIAMQRVQAYQASFQNDMGTGTGPGGGYLVPPAFSGQLLVALKEYFTALNLFDMIETTSGADLPWPTNDDTARRAKIIGENQQISKGDMNFGQVSLKAFLYATDAILVPWTLFQDSFMDLDGFIRNAIATAFGRTLADDLTTGTGVGMPQGVLTGAAAGPTSKAADLVYDDFVELIHSVDRAYRTGATFMMNDNTTKALHLLKDQIGRPLWVPSLVTGMPDTFAGYPVTVNESMPDIAAGATPILFGNLKNYKFRMVKQVSVVRLNERYADYLQTGYFGYARFGGGLPTAAAPLKKLVMAGKAGG